MYIFLNNFIDLKAVKHVNIFGNGYSSGPIINYPASYHDSICPNKATLVQYHVYFFTVKFLLRSLPFFTLRVKTSPYIKKISPLLTLNVKKNTLRVNDPH